MSRFGALVTLSGKIKYSCYFSLSYFNLFHGYMVTDALYSKPPVFLCFCDVKEMNKTVRARAKCGECALPSYFVAFQFSLTLLLLIAL